MVVQNHSHQGDLKEQEKTYRSLAVPCDALESLELKPMEKCFVELEPLLQICEVMHIALISSFIKQLNS